MSREVKIVDTTLRDGHQSQWATRMSTSMMLDVAQKLDGAGFSAIDLYGQPQIDAAVRYLADDPWQRVDMIRARIRQSPLRGWMRAKGFHFADIMAPDLIDLWVERQVAHGIDTICCFDGLNDIENLLDPLRSAKRHGATAVGILAFTLSPVHDDDLYAGLARSLVKKAKADIVIIKDSGGLLTPERCRALVPRIRAEIGRTPLEVHTHDNVGMAVPSYIAAFEAGADCVHTALWPLGGGIAPPTTQSVMRNFAAIDALPALDEVAIEEVTSHFERIADLEGFPKSRPLGYDVAQYHHQVPGGMASNFQNSLNEVGLRDRMPDVLTECIAVRRDLGYPMLITPFAQVIGGQALQNVIHGERYKVVLDGCKRFALGFWGTTPGPIDPDVMDKIIENGSSAIKPLDQTPPNDVADLRRRFPNMPDDERLLRNMISGTKVDEMIARRQTPTPYQFPTPTEHLVRELAKRSDWQDVLVSMGQTEFRLTRRRNA